MAGAAEGYLSSFNDICGKASRYMANFFDEMHMCRVCAAVQCNVQALCKCTVQRIVNTMHKLGVLGLSGALQMLGHIAPCTSIHFSSLPAHCNAFESSSSTLAVWLQKSVRIKTPQEVSHLAFVTPQAAAARNRCCGS